MAYVNFKPVCDCGYIFKNFTYILPQREEPMNVEREIIKIIEGCDNYFLPHNCSNCGERITNFSISAFTRNGKIIYNKEGIDIYGKK